MVRFRNTLIAAASIATGLFALSPFHPAWDCWPWNFGCFVVAITGADLFNGKSLTW